MSKAGNVAVRKKDPRGVAKARRLQARRLRGGGPPSKSLAQRMGRVDIPLLTIVLLLLLFGLVMLFSASYPSGYIRYGDSYSYIRSQMKFVVLGLGGMAAAALLDYRILKRFAWPLALLAFALLVAVLFMPAKNEAQRWIWFNSAQTSGFQPSEIAKFALILVFAKMVAANQHRMKTFRYGFFPFMVVLGAASLLLLLEPHLSCTILVLGIGLAMMFAGGAPVRWFVLGAALVGGLAALVVFKFPQLLPDYAMTRVQIWLDPLNTDPQKAHQTIQSLIAVGSGGLGGKGIGNSVQKFLYLPEVYNDYIYALVCEELGMVGGVVVMLLFLALLVRGMYLGLRAKDRFGALLAIGVSIQIALQAFLHIAVNLNAIPSTGISLPFFSYGGTSLCMLMGQIGVLLSVSRKASISANAQEAGGAPVAGEPAWEGEEELAQAEVG